jgi:hypothetical protein
MKDTFNMGYDLQQAGFDFAAAVERNNNNTELLQGIAADFVNASRQKAGIICDKKSIFQKFDESLPSLNASEPILILYIDAEAKLDMKCINRSNPLFHNLFVEDLKQA